MTAATILTLANAKGIDLLDPKASDYAGFLWAAEHLSKEARYNGATPNVVYSVAEHLVRGVDAILDKTDDRTLAAYFSLHDVHESVLKDWTTPLKQAIAEIASEKFGILAPQIIEAFKLLEYRHDVAIHEAAGLPWPMTGPMQALVKHWDLVMFVTEWRDLMENIEHPNPAPYNDIEPLAERIWPWPQKTARHALLNRWEELLPALRKEAA